MSSLSEIVTHEVVDEGVTPPIAVDLDGTLAKIDTLHEGLIACIKHHPFELHRLLAAIPQGKAAFKRKVAEATDFDASVLPYNQDLLDYLRREKAKGRMIGLFTAADQSIAEAVADHLGIFSVVRGSDGTVNLSGENKLQAIRDEFGEDFAYAGDGAVDKPLFQAARSAILVGKTEELRRYVSSDTSIEASFPSVSKGAKHWLKAIRLEHWSKNTLVFVAPIMALEFVSGAILFDLAALFLAMGLIASATYIINDLFDLSADRQHPQKRHRAFASGLIPAKSAVLAAGLMMAVGLSLLALVPGIAALSIFGYLGITLCYSFALKRQPVVDVFILAGLFTIRVFAGSAVMPTPISPWLLTFSMLFFLGLALVKRYAELERNVRSGNTLIASRGYTERDLPLILSAGVASGFSAIIIMTIYLIAEQYPSDVYNSPGVLWALMPIILIWTLRVWHLAVHGKMNEDPVLFALKDGFSRLVGILAFTVLILAWA